MWDPIGRNVTAPTSPKLNRVSSVANTYRQEASNTSAQWPASFSADATAAKFGSSGSESDFRRSVTRAQIARSGAVMASAGRQLCAASGAVQKPGALRLVLCGRLFSPLGRKRGHVAVLAELRDATLVEHVVTQPRQRDPPT